jgi:putative ABC transport system permease protein
MDALLLDVRHAIRSLLRSPGFALTAVLCLAAGIGASTLMFGVLDTLFLQPPPGVHDPARVLRLAIVRQTGMLTSGPAGGGGSYPNYLDLRQATHAFSSVAIYSDERYSAGRGAGARPVSGKAVSASYFTVFGARPIAGRFFADGEDTPPGPHRVIVVSHQYWQSELGGRSDAVGRTLVLDNQPYTVVGVTEPGFRGESSHDVDVWVPISEIHSQFDAIASSRLTTMFRFLGHLAPNVPAVGALREATTFVTRGDASDTTSASTTAGAPAQRALDQHPVVAGAPLLEALGPERPAQASLALWLFGAVICVMLVACLNLTNLLLARGTRRRHELAVRVSLGAGRARIMRQLMAECGVIAAAGGFLGLVLRVWGTDVARYFEIADSRPAFSGGMLLFTVAAIVVATIVAGVVPAVVLSRTSLSLSLRDGAERGSTATFRVQSWLLGGQAALSLAILAAAGLFLRSLQHAVQADIGVDTGHVVLASTDLKSAHYDSAGAAALYDRMLERIAPLPGVTAAAIEDVPMFSGSEAFPVLLATGPAPALPAGPVVNFVGPHYLSASGIRLIMGRDITDGDRAGSQPVAVVSEALARRYWPGRTPLGQCLKIGFGTSSSQTPCTEVVGVAAESRPAISAAAVPRYFIPRAQHSQWWLPTIVIRTREITPALLTSIRSAMRGTASDLPYVDVRPVRQELAGQIQPYRTGAVLFTIFGIATLLLAALGLYGVVAYVVLQRTRDIGIRMALGADSSRVVSAMMWQGLAPIGGGVAVGLLAALAASGFLRSRLYGVTPADPVTFVIVVAVMITVAALACFVPARRAARVDPVIALRSE